MKITKDIYAGSLSLLTDLYQITMAYGYWKSGNMDKEAVFNLFFRKNPFQSGFTVACGLEYVIDYLKNFKFREDDLAYLETLEGNDGQPLFETGFLDYLRTMEFSCDIDAVAEGSIVFPHEPLIRVKGSLIQGQLIETPLLNIINFQSLIATKSARIRQAAGNQTVLEFGLRRAQGIDGGLAASRAAYIGGASGTSNVMAGKIFGIPVKGTHAHSWVMSFEDELEAFKVYAESMPNNCIFLVDTYDTITGIKRAIEAGKILKEKGYKMVGIRLDSGDLAYFSNQARKLLDQAGFQETVIVASNDLDENIITSLKMQDADIDVWGIGTKLVTAYDQPALGGVYKVTAIRQNPESQWEYKMKLSEQAIKISNPGILQMRRFYDEDGSAIGDMIYDTEIPESTNKYYQIIDPLDHTRSKKINKNVTQRELLTSIFKKGKLVYESPNIEVMKTHCQQELQTFHRGIRRFINPHQYPVGLEKNLHQLKTDLILTLRKK